jgi:predicted TIM-barrel fold metal-dependent hydrolase
LALKQVAREDAESAFTAVQREAHEKGSVRLVSKPVVDYFCHIALEEADRQELPFQFHTGYGDPDVDLLLANPLYLRDAIERYPRARFILLHESYPYMRQAAFLAMVYPNVWADVSMVLPPLDWGENVQSFRQIMGVAPMNRIMYSSDATNIPEMHWLGPSRARSILRLVLGEMIDRNEIDEDEAMEFARLILHDNAVEVYEMRAPVGAKAHG